ncbi:hypothetical protein Mcup_1124 [Metallosphaera cuprina Ar-4]|uniref:Uncharacterized protein n=1 Tax=Metallosphaera cuprina (strain Ar-4) TaxID=1006006 RepID=F4G331_METCR|nr:hypothetical protein Mcup_1124 [Metallosphaera cuprina Ar-4]
MKRESRILHGVERSGQELAQGNVVGAVESFIELKVVTIPILPFHSYE